MDVSTPSTEGMTQISQSLLQCNLVHTLRWYLSHTSSLETNQIRSNAIVHTLRCMTVELATHGLCSILIPLETVSGWGGAGDDSLFILWVAATLPQVSSVNQVFIKELSSCPAMMTEQQFSKVAAQFSLWQLLQHVVLEFPCTYDVNSAKDAFCPNLYNGSRVSFSDN